MDTKKIQMAEEKLKNFSEGDESEEKLRLFNLLAWEKALVDFKYSLQISETNLKISLRRNYTLSIAECYRTLAYCQLMKTETEEAFKSIHKSLEYFDETDDKKGRATAWDILSHLNAQVGNLSKSLEYTYKVLQISQEEQDEKWIAWSLHNLGGVFLEMRELEKAKKNYMQSLRLFEKISYNTGITRISSQLGVVYFGMGDYENALKSHARTIACTQEPISVAYSLKEMGLIYVEQKEYTKAFRNYKKSLKILEQINHLERQAYVLMYIGKLYLLFNRIEKAEAFLKDALTRLKGEWNKLAVYKVYKEFAKLYEKKKDFEKALSYMKLYHKIKEEVFSDELSSMLKNLDIQYAVERSEKEAEIHRLKYVELDKERKKSEQLLRNILPDKVASELKENGKAVPVLYKSATVLFTDFVGFTQIAENMTPVALVNELDFCFSYFDSIINKNKLEKLKTIGDAYMSVGGIPETNTSHAVDTVLAALAIRQFMAQLKQEREEQGMSYWELRIGIHTGPLVAGVVGNRKFAYDVWGDTVNLASRMESSGEKGKINISESTYAQVKDFFVCKPRGMIQAKNKGKVKMYFVEGIRKGLCNLQGNPDDAFWQQYESYYGSHVQFMNIP
ncbi:MAG: adenylate/guanylate cyclase domain-containing protein [Spirochaetota bacterium]